jgi:hypothetical protein
LHDEVKKAQKSVQGELTRLRGETAKVEHVDAEVLRQVFPKHLFFSVLFRRYPVAQLPPDSLKSSNIYVVPNTGGKLRLATDSKELETFFRDNLAAVQDLPTAKQVMRAWLELTPMFLQDGYYKFAIEDHSTKALPVKGGIKAIGKVIVKAGGSGELDVTMTFDDSGKLSGVEQKDKVKRGVRPICQASKLLDQDPIVRAMAEQDLLVIGSAAKPYLDEQRAKGTLELQKAIDRIWKRILEDER